MDESERSNERVGTAAVPTGIESPRAKLVYLYLTTEPGATIGELSTALSLTKISLYAVLRTLRERELVERHEGGFVPAGSAG